MARLLYGSGLRLMECLRLRVKDVDFTRNEIVGGRGVQSPADQLAVPAPGVSKRALRRIDERTKEATVPQLSRRRMEYHSPTYRNAPTTQAPGAFLADFTRESNTRSACSVRREDVNLTLGRAHETEGLR